MKPKRPTTAQAAPAIPARAKTEVPADVIQDLMGYIRSQFVPHFTAQQWYQWQTFFKREIVTWPASYLTKRGVSIPPARYKEIVLNIFLTIQRHGDTGRVNFWPGYLQKAIKSHFDVHGDEYYEEGKSARTLAELVFLGVRTTAQAGQEVQDARTVENIAQIHAGLVNAKKKKAAKPQPKQLSLF